MNDPVYALCLRPVRVWRDIVFRRDGGVEHLKCPEPLHKRLWSKRITAGRADLPCVAVFDDHVGCRRAGTRDGHAAFMAACADTRFVATDLRRRAHEVIGRGRRCSRAGAGAAGPSAG